VGGGWFAGRLRLLCLLLGLVLVLVLAVGAVRCGAVRCGVVRVLTTYCFCCLFCRCDILGLLYSDAGHCCVRVNRHSHSDRFGCLQIHHTGRIRHCCE